MSTTLHDDDTHHLVRDRTALTAQQKLEAIALTPPMVQAAALMYIMLANGEVAAVPGGPGSPSRPKMSPLLQTVRDYVDGIPFERFLQDGPPILSVKERLGVLVNTYDAMLLGGEPHEAERARFDKLTVAFGIKPEALETFRQALFVKNNRAALGKFDSKNLDVNAPSPHVGLAAALVHAMMSPDGSIHPEDVSRLENVIGEYDGLVQFALNEAASVKPERLFETMSKVMTSDQKLFVLTNVLDTMLKDGEVEAPERKSIFQSMRSVLGFTENAIKPFVAAIKVKCAKSAASHDRFGGSIMRGIRANFEKKPIGFAKQQAEEAAALAAVNMQKVNRVAIPDQEPAQVGADGVVVSASAQGPILDGASQDKRQGHTKPGLSPAHARTSAASRASKRNGSEPNMQQIEAQAKLTTARQQLDSTRAMNAEILALLDQAQTPGTKPGSRKALKKPASRPARAPAAIASMGSMGVQAASGFRSAVAALQATQRSGDAARQNQNDPQRTVRPAVPGKSNEALLGADFSDNGFLSHFALPAALVLCLMMMPGTGSVWGGLAERVLMQAPCWVGASLSEHLHTPAAGASCRYSPRFRAANEHDTKRSVWARPAEESISAL